MIYEGGFLNVVLSYYVIMLNNVHTHFMYDYESAIFMMIKKRMVLLRIITYIYACEVYD